MWEAARRERCRHKDRGARLVGEGGGGWGCFFFNDTATTEIYTLSLHDALPISVAEQFLAPVQPSVAVGEAIGGHQFG